MPWKIAFPAYFAPGMQRAVSWAKWLVLRKLVLAALLFILIGTSLELYLIGHYEDWKQLIPLVSIGLALLFVVGLAFIRRHWMLLAFRALLGFTALSGIYGIYLHLVVNYEFEQEISPTADNWQLIRESLSGALPSLAPASLIVLALIGYSYSIIITQKDEKVQ